MNKETYVHMLCPKTATLLLPLVELEMDPVATVGSV